MGRNDRSFLWDIALLFWRENAFSESLLEDNMLIGMLLSTLTSFIDSSFAFLFWQDTSLLMDDMFTRSFPPRWEILSVVNLVIALLFWRTFFWMKSLLMDNMLTGLFSVFGEDWVTRLTKITWSNLRVDRRRDSSSHLLKWISIRIIISIYKYTCSSVDFR